MAASRTKPPFGLVMLAVGLLGVAVLVFRLQTSSGDTDNSRKSGPSASGSSPQGRASTNPPPAGAAGNVWAGIEPGDWNPAVQGDPELVYVPNGRAGTVEVIDPKTFRIIRRFSVGSFPEHVTPSWDLRWLYVDVSASSQLAVIDPRTGKATGRVIKNIDHPYNLYFTLDGSKAIVTAEYINRLDFRDPHTWRLIKSVMIPGGIDHLDFSADGHYLLIGTEFAGNVYKVDVVRMRVTSVVHVGGLPVDVKLSPDGSVFYVANQGLSGVSIIDPVAMRQIGFLRTGKGAHGFAVSRDTRSLYLSNRLAGTISVIDFATRAVVKTWHVGGSPDMLQVSPDGTQLWVSNRFGTTVEVVDTSTGQVTHTIEVGPDPHGLAYFPQPGHYSLGHNGVFR
jgi:YVTN family beta-propeller protein